MKNSTGKLCIFLPLVFSLMLLSSCREEPLVDNGPEAKTGNGMNVKFAIGGSETKSTYSIREVSKVMEPIDLSEESGIEGLTLTESVTSLDDVYCSPGTKGTPVFTENLAQMFESLEVTAFKGETDSQYGKKVDYLYDGKEFWTHNYSEGKDADYLRWPEDAKGLVFVVTSPDAPEYSYKYTTNSVSGKSGSGVGTLTVTGYVTPTGATKGTDAQAQSDILYSTKYLANNTNEGKVLLYHALTGVKFKVNIEKVDGIEITSITNVTFNKLHYKGSFTVKPAYEGYTDGSNSSNSYPTSADVVKWTLGTDTKSFSQDFVSADFTNTLTSTDDYTFPSSYTGSTANKNNLNDKNATKTFMFVPQKITNDVTLTITYKYKVNGGSEKTATTTIEFGKAVTANRAYEWLPGELRTYTLNIGDAVSISIDDTIPAAKQKSNLVIANTNTATCYIRVAAIGNWFTDAGTKDYLGNDAPISLTPCNQSELQAILDAQLDSKYWKKDGIYYYYLHPLAGGQTIQNAHTLFPETISFSSLTQPYTDCHLEVTIAAQAVLAAKVEEAWGSGIITKLGLKNDTID